MRKYYLAVKRDAEWELDRLSNGNAASYDATSAEKTASTMAATYGPQNVMILAGVECSYEVVVQIQEKSNANH